MRIQDCYINYHHEPTPASVLHILPLTMIDYKTVNEREFKTWIVKLKGGADELQQLDPTIHYLDNCFTSINKQSSKLGNSISF